VFGRCPLAVDDDARAQPHDLSRDDTLLKPWRDGSTALLVDPLELLERLAALVPSPRRPLLAGQTRTSIANTRRRSVAQGSRPDARRGSGPAGWAWPGAAVTIGARQPACGANTP
jgi:hypothetical protein